MSKINELKKLLNDEPAKLTLLGKHQNYLDLTPEQHSNEAHKEEYDNEHSVEVYRNFLNWLFATFKTTEEAFRKDWIRYLDLKKGQRVLITSCGLGEDIAACAKLVLALTLASFKLLSVFSMNDPSGFKRLFYRH